MVDYSDQLAMLLRAKLDVIFVGTQIFREEHTPVEFITTNRYIYLKRGRIRYWIDQEPVDISPGTLFLVPAWNRRRWESEPGKKCELLWCEFSGPAAEVTAQAIFSYGKRKPELEIQTFERMRQEWSFGRFLRGKQKADAAMPPHIHLLLEGELKASLARFWQHATASNAQHVIAAKAVRPEIRTALNWLAENFLLPKAGQEVCRQVRLTPVYFRELFQNEVGHSVSRHVLNLRMRHARYLVRHQPRMTIKEVAAQVGFNDPQYFSRTYHASWSITPSEDRADQFSSGSRA